MPKIFELLGFPLLDRSAEAEESRRHALCPFMEQVCDGGGNRYLSAVPLKSNPELARYFKGLAVVQAGVCSLQRLPRENPWIVCPRRLLALGRGQNRQAFAKSLLLQHTQYEKGTIVGVWAEVKLQSHKPAALNHPSKVFDYTLDYVLMPLCPVQQDDAERRAGLTWAQMEKPLAAAGFTLARRGKAVWIEDFPAGAPTVVEIMTSSTSGGNKRHRTTVPLCFEDAILRRDHQAPGINYRQVWARMVSQLIVKSEIAVSWGGRAIWILQDALVDYISSTTALDVRRFLAQHTSEVNMLTFSYGSNFRGTPKGLIELEGGQLYSGRISPSGLDSAGDYFQDMVRAPFSPRLEELVSVLLKRGPSGRLRV
jgi:hypothetical protein